jgi:hypothetical protein
MTINRFFFLIFGFLTFAVVLANSIKEPKKAMTVYHSKYCGCCKKWIEHMKASFNVNSVEVEEVADIKLRLEIPASLKSCHTAMIDGYILEGHVPMVAVKKLLKDSSKNLKGLVVPGMPIGSPGMEGSYNEKYHVIAFKQDSEMANYMEF